MGVALDDIEAAARSLHGRIVRTPSLRSESLSRALGCEVVLKLENLQSTGSFKTRGAYVKLAGLAPAQAKRGVVAMSAGNHAQGVAYHARALGIDAVIVMPETTAFTKVGRTERLGAKVIMHGAGVAEAASYARALARREGRIFIHPYDDPSIIAGQGTVGLEMLTDDPDLDVLVVPVGGGGLISGIAVAAKALKPRIKIVGAQCASYPAMADALKGRKPKPPTGAATLADGIAIKQPGKLTTAIVRRLVDRIDLADESDIETAMQLLVEEEKIVAEGAAAAAVAVALAHGAPARCKKLGIVVSGGNIDRRLLAGVLVRGLVREGRIGRLRIEIRDEPGALAAVTRLIGEADGNIIEIVHQRLFADVPAKMAEADILVETQDARHLRQVVRALRRGGFRARLLQGTARN